MYAVIPVALPSIVSIQANPRPYNGEVTSYYLFYGNVTIPFVDRFPRGEIYDLLTTRPEDLAHECESIVEQQEERGEGKG